MKTRILILALAILGSSLAFAGPVPHESETDCEKKVLNKIKRSMSNLHVKDYLYEGQKSSVIVTCFINENSEVEVARIDGTNEELKAAILDNFKEHPVQCKSGADGNYFTFRMAFLHMPA
jgi:hypothetical protein